MGSNLENLRIFSWHCRFLALRDGIEQSQRSKGGEGIRTPELRRAVHQAGPVSGACKTWLKIQKSTPLC
jgi:hypothetical protein